mmetsp:Transcript_53887/g.148586  ORF Transcript_53887/g.148586 Transcript_53887/m.148586 type:complete len:242 (-) Transcript_53887:168-893(-)
MPQTVRNPQQHDTAPGGAIKRTRGSGDAPWPRFRDRFRQASPSLCPPAASRRGQKPAASSSGRVVATLQLVLVGVVGVVGAFRRARAARLGAVGRHESGVVVALPHGRPVLAVVRRRQVLARHRLVDGRVLAAQAARLATRRRHECGVPLALALRRPVGARRVGVAADFPQPQQHHQLVHALRCPQPRQVDAVQLVLLVVKEDQVGVVVVNVVDAHFGIAIGLAVVAHELRELRELIQPSS